MSATVAAAAIGGIASLLSSLFTSSSSSGISKKQMQWQSSENQLDRDFNSSQSQLTRQFASEMMDKQYRQNSISSQMAQYKAAGVNPALAYSSGSSFVGASLPSTSAASHNGSYNPPAQKPFDASGVVSDAAILAQTKLLEAQTKNVNADTANKETQNDILKSDAAYRDAWNSSQLQLSNCNIQVAGSQIYLNRAEAAQLNEATENLIKQRDLIAAQVENLDADTVGKLIDNFYKSDQYEAVIDNISSQANLNRAQARDLMATLKSRLRVMNSQASVNETVSEINQTLLDYDYYKAQAANEHAKTENLKEEHNILTLQGEKADYDLRPQRTYYRDSMSNPGKAVRKAVDLGSMLLQRVGSFINGGN